MKYFLVVYLFLSFPVFANSVCRHGPPQSLGFPRYENFLPLPGPEDVIVSNEKVTSINQTNLISPQEKFNLRMKILILSATNDPLLEPTTLLAKKTLNNYGIPFEHFYLIENKLKINSLPKLYDPEGNPLFYGVILSTNLLAYQDSFGLFRSALTNDEWTSLNSFTSTFKIRLVSLYTYPNEKIGVQVIPLELPGKAVDLMPTSPFISLDKAYPENVKFNLSFSWAYGAKLNKPQYATPLLYYSDHFDDEGKPAIASILLETEDGRSEIHFFFAQSYLFTSSTAISSAWVNWLTRNMYIGKRRLYVNAHVDDVFLSTSLYSKYEDPTIDSPSSEKFIYRLTSDDLNLYLEQQEKEIRPLAKNDRFHLEMAFNGNGIIEHGGEFQDELLKTAKKNILEFSWVTHTFTHGDFDWLPYQKSKWELTTNILIANDFIPSGSPMFSANGIVTPRISGLFNPQALMAMHDVGLSYAVGDNTRKDLVPENIHHGLFTTKELNGYEGIFIIPRYATEIYYNTSLPNELADEYNFIYFKYFGKDSTPEEIYEREKKRVIRQLLSYEYSPYMFHQANLRSFPWNNKRESLIGLWLKIVFKEIRQYSNLPILSAKMNDLADLYFQRRNLDFCQLEVWQQIEKNNLKSLKLKNGNACKVQITLNNDQSISRWNKEIYGPEKTYFQSFSPNQTSVYQMLKD
jgi:hypothetical protein